MARRNESKVRPLCVLISLFHSSLQAKTIFTIKVWQVIEQVVICNQCMSTTRGGQSVATQRYRVAAQ